MKKLPRELVKFGKKSKVHLYVALLGIALLYAAAFIEGNLQTIWSKLHSRVARRLAAMALSVCMVFTLFPSVAFAEEANPITTGTSSVIESDTPEVYEEHTVHDESCGYKAAVEEQNCGHLQEDGGYRCAPVKDSAEVSGNEASISDSDYVCGHSDDCGYATAVEGVDCTFSVPDLTRSVPECICAPVDGGEVIHGEDCPLYEAPVVAEQVDAIKNVLALINALPTMDELGEQDVEGVEFPAYLAQLRLDVAAARLAYDALADEEKAAFDADALAKLTELEGILTAMPVLMGTNAITITVNGGTAVGGTKLSTAITASTVAIGSITTLTITAGTVTADDWAYLKSLTKLTDFTIDEAVTAVAAIPAAAVNSQSFPSSIVNVTIPQAITIGNNAFKRCKKLDTINFPAATDIGSSAFQDCIMLKSVNIPRAEGIGTSAFNGCTMLKSVSFPLATILNWGVFTNCTALKSVSLPATTSIGPNAFSGCTALTTLKLGAGVPTVMNANAFTNCPPTRALVLVDANGAALDGDTLTTAQTAYDAVSDGIADSTTADRLWYGWTICACVVSVPTFAGANITIPSEQASATHELSASGSLLSGICPATWHTNTSVTYSVAIKTDANSIASIEGTTLTVTGAGSVVVTATATANSVTATADATFTVTTDITGTVAITGTLKFGEILTATVNGGSNTGTLSYQWQRGGNNITSATGSTYTTVAADVGQTLTCVVTSSAESGSIVGTTTAVIGKAGSPAAPAAPTISYANETVATLATWEYKVGTGTWTPCTANMATTAFGWDGNTAKTVQFRIKTTTTHEAGAEVSLTIPAKPNAPLASAFTITKPTTIGGTDGKLGGITSDMEYHTGSGTYTIGGAELTGIAGGTDYTIRNKSTASAFASKTVGVTVNAPDTYMITYNANGGSGVMTNGTATENMAFALPTNTFTAPAGKQFKAWAIGSTNGTPVNAGATHTFTADTTVYAVWEAPLTGTVAITGTLKFNQILTATVSGGNNTGTLSYQWQRGGSNIASATGSTYNTVAADVGQTLICVVTSTVQTGDISSTATAAIAKADGPTAPTAPTISYANETVATLTTWEYRVGTGTWTACTATMAATVFGWDGDTAKTVEFRIKATATHEAGAEVSLTIPAKPNAPLASAFTITKPTTTGGTDGKLGGITSDMEYHTGNGAYTIGSAELTGIADGTAYTIRNKSTVSAFASKTVTVTVASKVVYSGTQAAVPSSTPTVKTATSIILAAVTVTGETVEYAKSTTSTAPTTDSDWQTSTTFTGLSADTPYYFFARVKENETHMAGTASVGTAITTDKSDAQKVAAAKPLAETAVANLTATNSTTADSILSALNTAIASVPDVTAAWKAAPTITPATDSAAGSITGTIRLTCGGSTAEVTVNLPIAQLPVDIAGLTAVISDANTAKTRIAVNDNAASSVASGTRFVTTAEMNALTNAIAAAQAVANNAASTATQVNAAIATLNTAVIAFNTAIKTGTYSGSSSGGGGGSGGGGSGGGATPPTKPTEPVTGESNTNATVDDKGNATVNVTEKNIFDAVKAAQDAATKKGVNGGEVTAIIKVTSPANRNPNTVSVNLPKIVQEQVISSKIGNVVLVIDKPDIAIGMNLTTITEMNRQANADIQISATRTDATKLSTEAKNAIGSRPAFNLKATYANGSKSITSFGSGQVSVAIPYTLQKGEIAGGLYAVYVDGNGKVNDITNSSYDAENKVLRFSTNHFSVYGISYKAPIAFTDIATHWAKTDIEFAVNRGLMKGTSNTTFAPNSAMTYGMFVTALGRLSGVHGKNITDTTFAPEQAITRQEMATIMSSYAKALGYQVPETRVAVTFADNSSIARRAAPAVKQMQMAGILNGKDGNRFDPTGIATRGEISAMLRRYVELVIDRTTTEGFTTNDSGSSLYYQSGKAVTGTQTIRGVAYTFNGYGETTRETAVVAVITPDAALPDDGKKYITYKLVKGDTLWDLARKYGTTVNAIMALNSLENSNLIHVGTEIKIPQIAVG